MLHVIGKFWRYRCHKITTKIVCYSLLWTSIIDHRMNRPTSTQQWTFANIRLWKHRFPAFHNFLNYGSESSTGAKVKGYERYKGYESCLWSERSTGVKVPWNKSSWNIRSWGAKVPGVRKFHWTKVLGLFASRERMFHETKVPLEWKFSLWTFRCRERKCRGTKRPDTLLNSNRPTRLLNWISGIMLNKCNTATVVSFTDFSRRLPLPPLLVQWSLVRRYLPPQ